MMRYYKISCMQGHHGTGKSVDISFVFEAKDINEAIDRAKAMPSIKHSRPILFGKEISREEYIERRKINAYHWFKSN